MHLHPLSFRHLDSIRTIDELRIVQINKDVGGPNVHEMVPQFLKVLEKGKNLAIGMGRVDQNDIDAILNELPGSGWPSTSSAKSPRRRWS